MATSTVKMTAARSFVRSLNILLKFVRLYGFDHIRAGEQFQNAWSELRAAIPAGDESGLLLAPRVRTYFGWRTHRSRPR